MFVGFTPDVTRNIQASAPKTTGFAQRHLHRLPRRYASVQSREVLR